MSGVHADIEHRILNFNILLEENPTPLLRQEMLNAIEMHRMALQQPNVNPYLKDLNILHAQIDEHWSRVNQDMITKAFLTYDIIALQLFLSSKLMEDYLNKPYKVQARILCMGGWVEKQGEDCSEKYKTHVTFPIEEYMLNKDDVENKLRTVTARQGHPGNDIQPLIERCDWDNLAAVLTRDRELASMLPLGPSYTAEMYKRVMQGIDQIQTKYFTSVTGPSRFTISTHAKEMSLGRGSKSGPVARVTEAKTQPSEASPEKGSIRQWYHMVAGSLKSRKSASDAESSISLIDHEKQD